MKKDKIISALFEIRSEINLGNYPKGLYLSGRRCAELVEKLDKLSAEIERLEEPKSGIKKGT